nr:hypothetical protein GA0070560_104329 [uncultured bacterium]
MEHDDRPFARFAANIRHGYHTWVWFMAAVYGGEPASKAAEISALEHMYRIPSDSTEKAP